MDDDWMRLASCSGVGPELFYPEEHDLATTRQAKLICESCLVIEPCRAQGMFEIYGIWGGTTERERQRERSQRGWRWTGHCWTIPESDSRSGLGGENLANGDLQSGDGG